jgi:A/G-specific adenine glycosylase
MSSAPSSKRLAARSKNQSKNATSKDDRQVALVQTTQQIKPSVSVDFDLPSFSWATLSELLLVWYAQSRRDLPWRRTRDPYAIWVSEIMLQQTQVKTVLPYYDRWLKQFPDVQTLAETDLQVVLKAWEGLGYYARARNLHKAAEEIVARFDSEFPQTLAAALTLPGIGRTTAGGILSSAFNLPLPIMDGNVKRVLARLTGLMVPPSQVIDQLWQISSQLVPERNGRDFNQALMDLGATVCTPKRPACLSCPWQECCQAHQQGKVAEIPVPQKRAAGLHKTIAVALIWDQQGQVLIDLRPQTGLLGGLWEFPSVEVEVSGQKSVRSALQAGIRQDFGVQIQVRDELLQVNHAYTHFKVTFHVYQCDYLRGVAQAQTCDQVRWVNVDNLHQFPFPKSHLRMIQALRSAEANHDPWA